MESQIVQKSASIANRVAIKGEWRNQAGPSLRMTKDSCPPTFRPCSGKMVVVLVADASQRSGLRPRGRNLRGFLTHALE